MTVIILVLFGVVCEIVKANTWFVIPNFVSYILFGLSGIILLTNMIKYFSIKYKIYKISKKLKR